MQKSILLLGWGKMGSVEGKALVALREHLAPENIDLVVTVVERSASRRENAAHYTNGVFESGEQALDALGKKGMLPEILVMALNDTEHFPAFQYAFEKAPGIKAVFSEKPLTATNHEADALYPVLNGKFISLDTIIHFSPVFDRLREITEGQSLSLTKLDCTWAKDRTSDQRPTIGIASDIVHPLGIVSEMFRQGPIKLIKGIGYQGKLSDHASNVIFDIDTQWMTSRNLPVWLRASYAEPKQKRQIVAHYKQVDGKPLMAVLDFDIYPGADSLKLFSNDSDGRSPVQQYSYVSKPKDVDTGYPTGILVPDRISAFIGWSMRAYLKPSDLMANLKISGLAPTKIIQDAIGQVNGQNPALSLTDKPAVEVLAQRLRSERPSAIPCDPRYEKLNP